MRALFKSRFRTFHLVKLRTIHFRQILTFIPREEPDLPKLACLTHYRAESGGWRNDIHCPACVASYQTNLRRFTHCLHPDTLNCPCLVCVRQPPPLLTSASHTLFLMVLQLNRFTLTHETTYEQYYMALRSRRVPPQQLLPPDYPHITLRFQCKNFMHKTHPHCPRPDVKQLLSALTCKILLFK